MEEKPKQKSAASKFLRWADMYLEPSDARKFRGYMLTIMQERSKVVKAKREDKE